ncbi:helix-turn-helix transcriptional regulator [Cryptosporangium phraense]|uniref:Helix-turn-helix domain-containing protein n=1 Tax=Cryptosporangium phraense TaxID=2593070 RepID=A0A545AHI6_9ACTN|nr:helix-turn-helix transcriptional regulator [Cryptosporangium phraense]TQS40776.1 helix-turn-helix domain-containing protein [Cryptosporangium phraense]
MSSSAGRASEIGAFLRARRDAVRPEEFGLPVLGRRRVPGLRREELAQLAGVSPDYYVRLEQGRGRNVSDSVLDAVAQVLRLSEVEREHLRNLARPGEAVPSRPLRPVRSGLQVLLDMMATVPAFVMGRRMDVVAWNGLGDAVNGFTGWSAGPPNVARWTFLDPRARSFYLDWETVAGETVAYLRLYAGRHPSDPALAALLGDLSLRSPEFVRLWAGQRVKEKTFGAKLLRHPIAGELELAFETLALPGEPDLLLVTYTAVPGSADAEKLQLLASWVQTTGGRGVLGLVGE